jgi:hypothetical protein
MSHTTDDDDEEDGSNTWVADSISHQDEDDLHLDAGHAFVQEYRERFPSLRYCSALRIGALLCQTQRPQEHSHSLSPNVFDDRRLNATQSRQLSHLLYRSQQQHYCQITK